MLKISTLKETFALLSIKLLAILPLAVSRLMGRFLGRLVWMFSRKQVHFSVTNIQHCLPHWQPQRQQLLVKQSLSCSGELIADLSATWLWSTSKLLELSLEKENMHLLETAYKRAKGVLLISPHIGNWEIMGPLLSAEFEFAAMYKPPRIMALDKLIKTSRENAGSELFTADSSGVRSLLKAIKQGKMTLLLPDQEPHENSGMFVPFFNQPAWTMTLPAKILQKTDCEILFSIVVRTSDGFKFIIRQAPEINSQQSVEEISTHINQGMEKLILEYPEQYQWSYKRFYKQPENQPQIYL